MKQYFKAFGKNLFLTLTGGRLRTQFNIHGLNVYVPVSVGLKIRFIIARKRYENAEAALIRQELKQGDNVIELGGALGIISKVIRNQIGKDAMHIVVEPNKDIIEICKINAETSEVVYAAIAYGTRTVSMTTTASLLDNRVDEHTQATNTTEIIPAITLSSLVTKMNGTDFILVCDIEGAEAQLVDKDPKAFKNCRKIIMEVHDEFIKQNGYDLKDMILQLTSYGFTQTSLNKNVLFMVKQDTP